MCALCGVVRSMQDEEAEHIEENGKPPQVSYVQKTKTKQKHQTCEGMNVRTKTCSQGCGMVWDIGC